VRRRGGHLFRRAQAATWHQPRRADDRCAQDAASRMHASQMRGGSHDGERVDPPGAEPPPETLFAITFDDEEMLRANRPTSP
jgi:hypothetical protein